MFSFCKLRKQVHFADTSTLNDKQSLLLKNWLWTELLLDTKLIYYCKLFFSEEKIDGISTKKHKNTFPS
jgi:hypothetical protein